MTTQFGGPELKVGAYVEVLRGAERLPHGAIGKRGHICRVDAGARPFYVDLGRGDFAYAKADELKLAS